MKAIDIIIGVGWIVFWAYWLVMATTAKAGRSRWTRLAAYPPYKHATKMLIPYVL